jgi:hypothetical protein
MLVAGFPVYGVLRGSNMKAVTPLRSPAMLAEVPAWFAVMAGVALVSLQVAILHGFGQPLVAASGRIALWVGNPSSSETSQQLADWYSFSHIVHGFIFFGLLRLAVPRLPLAARLLIAMGIEIGWEITENTPAVIQHYRKQALAAGYVGDSILNSISDTVMMSAGFVFASRVRARIVIALAIGLEVFTACAIRDNLTLNVLNLVAPSQWAPIQAIHDWQAGGIRGHAGQNIAPP